MISSFFQLKQNLYTLDLKLFSSFYIKAFLIIFSWYLISLLWTPDFYLGIKYIFYLICGIGLLLSVVYYSKNIKYLNKIFKALSALMLIELCIASIGSFTNLEMITIFMTVFLVDPLNIADS